MKNEQQVYARQRVQELENQFLSGGWTNSAGIYGIVVNDRVIYVGQSKKLAQRLAQHVYEIEKKHKTEKKYEILDEISDKARYDQKIRFTLLEETANLNERENYYISELKPILNTMTPDGKHNINGLTAKDVLESVGVDTDKIFIF